MKIHDDEKINIKKAIQLKKKKKTTKTTKTTIITKGDEVSSMMAGEKVSKGVIARIVEKKPTKMGWGADRKSRPMKKK